MFAGPQIRNRIQMPSEFYDFDTFHEGLKYEIVLNMLTEDKLNMSMGNILQYGGYFQEEMSNYSEGSPAAIGAKSFKQAGLNKNDRIIHCLNFNFISRF